LGQGILLGSRDRRNAGRLILGEGERSAGPRRKPRTRGPVEGDPGLLESGCGRSQKPKDCPTPKAGPEVAMRLVIRRDADYQ
jgi:hypothetical protein